MSWTTAFRAAAFALVAAACAQSESAGPPPGQSQSLPVETLSIVAAGGSRTLQVEIADDEQERELGLMFRRQMAPDHGMLFDFNPPQRVSFWMRNTILPLDIIFIAADGRILNIAENTTPFSEAPIPGEGTARGVLEINARRARELGIVPGDHVCHRIFTPSAALPCPPARGNTTS